MATAQVDREKRIILAIGPARSGKSEWAETLARDWEKSIIYVATAQVDPTDPEWQARIEQHQSRRPADWKTLHIPINLSQTIQGAIASECLLVDSLGTWVANLLDLDEEVWEKTVEDLLATVKQAVCDVIFVAEETGWGVVPAYASGRMFRDRLGSLTRRIGAIANPVYLVTGGHVLNLSEIGSPLP